MNHISTELTALSDILLAASRNIEAKTVPLMLQAPIFDAIVAYLEEKGCINVCDIIQSRYISKRIPVEPFSKADIALGWIEYAVGRIQKLEKEKHLSAPTKTREND